MKVSDILPALSLARSQRVNLYSKEGMLLRTIPRDMAMTDPRAAAGATLWDCEVIQLDACSPAAFNIIAVLPDGRIHI